MKLFVRAVLSSCIFYSCNCLAGPGEIPNFNLKSLVGTPYKHNDLRGKVSLLYFWASWCKPCQRQLPALDKFFLQHSGPELLVLGINEDVEAKDAQAYLQAENVHFPMLLDKKNKLAADIELQALPTLILVKPDGEIAGVVLGPDVAGQSALLRQAEALLLAQP